MKQIISKVKNDLFDYSNRFIYQSNIGFKFSLDSILLAEFVDNLCDFSSVLDLCTGNCAIPLILTTKADCQIDCIEIQDSVYSLGEASIKENDLVHNIHIYKNDVLNLNDVVKGKKYDIITCNPPYFKIDKNSYLNMNKQLQIARHEICIKLEDIFRISSEHMNDGSSLFLVHRSNRLDEIIMLANKYHLNVKKIQLIKTKASLAPTIVLIKAVKGAKLGVLIKDEICIENLTTYQNLFKEEK